MTHSTYLFFQGSRCALLGAAVGKVTDFDSHFTGESLSLDQLGLESDPRETPVRLLLLQDAVTQFGLVVRGPIEVRAVADKDIIPLPLAFFVDSAFSALVRTAEQRFALLLAVPSLLYRGNLPSRCISPSPCIFPS